ncbi:MAG: hypothetical protein ABH851_09000 [Methanobacteriota archaeon]
MVHKVRSPKVLSAWPKVLVDSGEDMLSEITVNVFSARDGPVSLPNLNTRKLKPHRRREEAPTHCESVRDVVVKHAYSLCDPARKIPDDQLLPLADQLGAQAAFAYAYRDYTRHRPGSFIHHATQVLGFARPRNCGNVGMRCGFIGEDQRVNLNTINAAGVFSDIPGSMIGKIGELPGFSQQNNLVLRLQNVARAVVTEVMWERTHSFNLMKGQMGLDSAQLKELKILADRLGISPPDQTLHTTNNRIKKRQCTVKYDPNYLRGLKNRVVGLVDKINLSEPATENRIEQAGQIGENAVIELSSFVSANTPTLGAKIAGIPMTTYRRKMVGRGLSLGEASTQYTGIDSKKVNFEGLEDNRTLMDTVTGWCVERMLRSAVNQASGNISELSRVLGVSRPTVRSYIEKYGLKGD